jgi:hypothetical protein
MTRYIGSSTTVKSAFPKLGDLVEYHGRFKRRRINNMNMKMTGISSDALDAGPRAKAFKRVIEKWEKAEDVVSFALSIDAEELVGFVLYSDFAQRQKELEGGQSVDELIAYIEESENSTLN